MEKQTVVYYEEDGDTSRGNAVSSVSVEATSSSTLELRIVVPTKHPFCFSLQQTSVKNQDKSFKDEHWNQNSWLQQQCCYRDEEYLCALTLHLAFLEYKAFPFLQAPLVINTKLNYLFNSRVESCVSGMQQEKYSGQQVKKRWCCFMKLQKNLCLPSHFLVKGHKSINSFSERLHSQNLCRLCVSQQWGKEKKQHSKRNNDQIEDLCFCRHIVLCPYCQLFQCFV